MGRCISCAWVGRLKLIRVVNPMIVYGYVMWKWKKNYLGRKGAHFWEFPGYSQWHQVIWIIFIENVELRWKKISRPQNEWFGEVFNFSMFNMFSWLYHSLLIFEGNSCLILMLDHSFSFCHQGACKTPKNGKNVSKNCWCRWFCHFRVP